MKKTLAIAVSACTFLQLFFSQASIAWNDFGHMSVAYIAYKNLNEKTRERVDKLLKLNPMYAYWNEQIPADSSKFERNAQICMMAATWPDQIKKDANYFADGDADGNRPSGPDSARNIGYADKFMHKYWHFYDRAFSQDGSKVRFEIPDPNAYTQVAVCRKTLASDANDELKSYDLCWLMHMVGDLHQPMHCATRASRFAPYGDNGGNEVWVSDDENPKMRLHGFWDGCLGSGPSFTVKAFADSLPGAKKSQVSKLNTKDWLQESFLLTKKQVYVPPIKWGNGPFKLNDSYKQSALELSKKRVALAGMRLASILNGELR
ncbi:MAG: S1/P1 nuclease [Candidatus Obscuribacterales bacterium]|nr:S1/P1 nuclease [Candidatus Obscuribacterales bacterium]